MNTTKRIFLFAFNVMLLLSTATLNAQVTIGSEQEPNANALLDLKENASGTASKGLLLPRVALTSTIAASPLTAHVAGMTVYNTATTTGNNSVTPGVYYNDGAQWVRQQEAVEIDTRTIVYVNSTDPNSATIFSFETPDSEDFVNDNNLKESSSYIYVSTDGKTWYYSGGTYISFTQPTTASTAWYNLGTTVDAGATKTGAIERLGRVRITNAGLEVRSSIVSGSSYATFYVDTPESTKDQYIAQASTRIRMSTKVAAGKTQSGRAAALGLYAYYSGKSNQAGVGGGTLAFLRGIELGYGVADTDAVGTVTDARGFYVVAYKTSGIIKNAYDFYAGAGINEFSTTGTKHYGIFIAGGGKMNYIAGKTLFTSGIQLGLATTDANAFTGNKYTLKVNSGKLQWHNGTAWVTIAQ